MGRQRASIKYPSSKCVLHKSLFNLWMWNFPPPRLVLVGQSIKHNPAC